MLLQDPLNNKFVLKSDWLLVVSWGSQPFPIMVLSQA